MLFALICRLPSCPSNLLFIPDVNAWQINIPLCVFAPGVICSGDWIVSSFVCFGCWMLVPVHILFAAWQFLNVLELMSWFRCEVPSYLGATAKQFSSYMTLIYLNCYQIFSVLGSRRGNVFSKRSLVHSFLGQRVEPHQVCPCLMWVQASHSDNTDSNYAIARKVDWFCLQHSEVCWNHRVSRQVQVAG